MKTKKLVFALVTALAVSAATVIASASISGGPDQGAYKISNTANGAVLTFDSRDPSYLTCALGSATTWNIVEKTTYYLITTLDGKQALEADGGYVFLRDVDQTNPNQQWSILQAQGGFTIQLKGQEVYMGFEGNDLKTQGSKPAPGAANYANYIWNGAKAAAAPTPTLTPTPTPAPANTLPKAPVPTSNPANGSTIPSGSTIQLIAPNLPNAYVVYSMIDPNRVSGVSWYQTSTTPINLPASGTVEFWAKTIPGRGYAESDIVHFVFQVQRGTPTPPPTQTPTPPPSQLNQVILKVTMNQLRYTVNGTPMMFDVPPYLDTKANRSMIPMRFIAEAFGATVDWNDATKTQTIMLNGKTFKLTENVPLPDGMGTPVLVKDRFFVPLRYVSQELGASVDWDDATQTNTIIYYK